MYTERKITEGQTNTNTDRYKRSTDTEKQTDK